MVTEVFERLLESLANIYCAFYVLGRARHCGHRWISIDFALQGFGSSSGPVGDAEERTIHSTVSPLHTNLQAANFQRCKHAFRQGQVWVKLQPVLHLLLLMIFQLYRLPPPLPPPVSNSSCLFTWCQSLYASCCTVQFSSVAQSCPTLCDPVDCSTPGFLVHHQLLELTQTPVHRVGDAIQPSHPLSSPSPFQSFPASGSFPMSQFFTSGGQSIGVSASASVFPMNIQDWFPLGWTGWISLQSKGLYCTTVLFKVRYCKTKNVLFVVFVFYVLFVWKVL